MNHTKKLLTTALVASTMLAAPALAGSLTKPLDSAMNAGASVGAGVGVGADVSGKAGGTGVQAGAKADVETTGSVNAGTGNQGGNQGDVVSSIQGNGAAAADIDAMAEISEVQVIRVAPPTEEAGKAIDNAVKQNGPAIDELRQALDANASVKDKLSQAGVDVESVVAARTAANGTLTVYVR